MGIFISISGINHMAGLMVIKTKKSGESGMEESGCIRLLLRFYFRIWPNTTVMYVLITTKMRQILSLWSLVWLLKYHSISLCNLEAPGTIIILIFSQVCKIQLQNIFYYNQIKYTKKSWLAKLTTNVHSSCSLGLCFVP